MMRRSPMCLAALCIAGFALGACSSPTAADDALSVSFTSDATAVGPQQPVTFSITVVNQSSLDASLYVTCGPHFEVKTLSGAFAGPPTRMCTAVLYRPTVVAPGASYTFEDAWSGLGAPPNSQVGHPLAAGSYLVTARVRARISGRERLFVSEPVAIRVGSDESNQAGGQ